MTKQLHVALAALGTVLGVLVAGVGVALKLTHDLAWALVIPGALVAVVALAIAADLDREPVKQQ